MNCPSCSYQNSKVLESRLVEDGVAIRRRRECLKCGARYTTYERVETANLLVVKKGGVREQFDRKKLAAGIYKAFEKRSTPASEIETLISDIEVQLKSRGESEVSTNDIGEVVMERLKAVDDVAYVRFASVYRSFADIQSFEEVLRSLKRKKS
ncbi:transcriptional repressor NrdR [bacterium]|nr:transcriptional repressor NrdR [bacterium]